uniref:NADH-cytochrome b5 reductase n=1 Tax=Chlamydomonas leiostraca TaxID=1034604 RepID=A0A7S0RQ42_9CHLO|mmetsp:Transcript_28187/g.71868  ORF Transcript_28187/g.71868 Transcript_28187/m.71868 type:complete len:304 (+) Transcript_28187:83-994(+)|eukprot:CAMPEP_0202857564 /NCGR_PEP_ID=MMETSP1391-20130828/458_1 /ASSEMBLY_ACC=CAM_ASM_000867 /TAXON_ID=1034604 /ORGANISM="Chlamydomonas leiostraca, Strain SAG 11-49" /LENGTH=303 /DNA_ID=CAMNT_0049536379 /DNA_START=86 /DNA_END=997 /DNA_ORIENTATION=+
MLQAAGRQYRQLAAAGAFAAGMVLMNERMGFIAEADKPKNLGALDPQEFKPFKITAKKKLTHDTYLYTFELPNNQASGLHTASCLVTRAMITPAGEAQPKPVVRPYTPVSPPGARGYLDLAVKVYPKGTMSKHIGSLKPGDTLEMKGPIPKYPYQPNIKKNIGMVAGGTGIAPMLQVIDTVLANPDDKTRITLVYGSVSPADIIFKDKLDALSRAHPDRLRVVYTVDRRGWGGLLWGGNVGVISKDLLSKHMPPPDKDNLIMVCGPPGMMDAVSGNKAKDFTQGELTGALKALGYTSAHVFKF